MFSSRWTRSSIDAIASPSACLDNVGPQDNTASDQQSGAFSDHPGDCRGNISGKNAAFPPPANATSLGSRHPVLDSLRMLSYRSPSSRYERVGA